jgi:tetratricopeptide (TPR) repeat protein
VIGAVDVVQWDPRQEWRATVTQDRLRSTLGVADERVSTEQALQAVARTRLMTNDTADLDDLRDELLALDLADQPDAALLVATIEHRHRAPVEPTRQLADRALEVFTRRSDLEGVALAHLLLGHIAFWEGDTAGAAKWWDAAADLPIAQATPAELAPFRVVIEHFDRGAYAETVPHAHQAYAVAMVEGSTVDEANATVIAGLVQIDSGMLAQAAETLLRAQDLFSEVEPVSLAGMWPLVPLGLSEIAARRGQRDEALAHYAEARTLAERLERPGLLAVARAMPAVHLPYQPDLPWPLEEVLAEAQAAVELFGTQLAHPILRQFIARAVAAAHLALGQADEALTTAVCGADEAPNPLMRAKALMLVGAARVQLDEPARAAEAFDEAREIFAGDGVDLWSVEALLELAELRDDTASESLEQAYRLTHDDPGFARLWARRPHLLLDVAPGRRPAFRSGDRQLRLGTTGAELAAIVIRAGDTGVHWETVAAELWPHEDSATRIKSRITSLTALVRQRLGTEAWRLRRDGPRFSFILLEGDQVVVT